MEQKISVKDLKIGQMVVGLHHGKKPGSYERRAGVITAISTSRYGDIVYHIQGRTHQRPDSEPLSTSGLLEESEVQVIDQDACNEIIGLFNVATEQIMAHSLSFRETAEQVNEIIGNEYEKLKAKCGVSEGGESHECNR